jgi:hypothetical protein
MPVSPTQTPLHVALLHPDERQRSMLSSALNGVCASFASNAQWIELAKYPLRLGGVWVLFDQGEETLKAVHTIRKSQENSFWGILILGQRNATAQQLLRGAGSDAYLSYPFDFPALIAQLKSIAEKHAPVSIYQVLPPQVASGMDRVWARFDQLNYYDILELDPSANIEEIKARFHQRSLVLHPDRHRSIKTSHSPVYDRVNLIYKRVLESYRILIDPLQRPLYDASLPLGVTRWNYHLEEKRKAILKTSDRPDTHLALARTLSLRSRGLLKPAYDLILSICQQEPMNIELQNTAHGYQKLIELASRERDIAMALEQQVAP